MITETRDYYTYTKPKLNVTKKHVSDIVSDIVEVDDFGNGYGEQLLCPVCREEYVHLSQCEFVSGEDAYVAWEGRGDAVFVNMWCEQGHFFRLRFGGHKGLAFLSIEIPKLK